MFTFRKTIEIIEVGIDGRLGVIHELSFNYMDFTVISRLSFEMLDVLSMF